jgi:endonuclease/exonuclease/phosphatase family metal-dependent hydrolase
MRRLTITLLVLVSVVMTAASGRTPATAAAADTFRVVTFNIHKGADRREHYHLDRTIDAIQQLNADLVGLQEVMRNHEGFNCDDQPALIAEGLRQRTGRPWTHAYVKSWITENRRCLERGHGDEVETEGVAFFAPERMLSTSSVRLSEGRVGLAVRLASMPRVPVIVTHLAANRQNAADRAREIAALLPWAATHGPGLLIGDLNAPANADELTPVLARYRDAWAEAFASGRTGGVATGSTRPGRRVSRIDYVLFAPEIDFALESVEVVDTVTLGLGEVSDHHPVVATFRRHVRPTLTLGNR